MKRQRPGGHRAAPPPAEKPRRPPRPRPSPYASKREAKKEAKKEGPSWGIYDGEPLCPQQDSHTGYTYQSRGRPSEDELKVIQKIVLREELVREMFERARENTGDWSDFAGRFARIRAASVEVIEEVEQWRRQFARPYPFVFGGANYLQKMPTDLDVMQQLEPLVALLGYSLLRNPFALPDRLDKRPATPVMGQREQQQLLLRQQQQQQQQQQLLATQEEGGDAALPMMGGDPYNLMPQMGGVGGGVGVPSQHSQQQQQQQQPPPVLPSTPPPPRASLYHTVHDLKLYAGLDPLRVRYAEKVLLQEEALQGRYGPRRDNFDLGGYEERVALSI